LVQNLYMAESGCVSESIQFEKPDLDLETNTEVQICNTAETQLNRKELRLCRHMYDSLVLS
jgi:hypothetical protein